MAFILQHIDVAFIDCKAELPEVKHGILQGRLLWQHLRSYMPRQSSNLAGMRMEQEFAEQLTSPSEVRATRQFESIAVQHSTEHTFMGKHKRVRSPRFAVPNNEQVLISIGAEKLKCTLHLLSMTGGTIQVQRGVPSGTFADITIKTDSGNFSAAIEFLAMARGNTQAFRFVAMGPGARDRLNEALSKMRKQGLAIEKTPMDDFRSLARRVLSFRAYR